MSTVRRRLDVMEDRKARTCQSVQLFRRPSTVEPDQVRGRISTDETLQPLGYSENTLRNLILPRRSLARQAMARHATQAASAHKNRIICFAERTFSLAPQRPARTQRCGSCSPQ